MPRPRKIFWAIFVVLLGACAGEPARPQLGGQQATAVVQADRCFNTGFCIQGDIAQYWMYNGGDVKFGKATSPRWADHQWFEKGRLDVSAASPPQITFTPGSVANELADLFDKQFSQKIMRPVDYVYFSRKAGMEGWFLVNVSQARWNGQSPVDLQAVQEFIEFLQDQAPAISKAVGFEVKPSAEVRRIIYLLPPQIPFAGQNVRGLTRRHPSDQTPSSALTFLSPKTLTGQEAEYIWGVELCQQALDFPDLDKREGVCNTIGRMHPAVVFDLSVADFPCPTTNLPNTGNPLKCFFTELAGVQSNMPKKPFYR